MCNYNEASMSEAASVSLKMLKDCCKQKYRAANAGMVEHTIHRHRGFSENEAKYETARKALG